MHRLILLIAEWRGRLKRLRALAEDSAGGHAWLWAIRCRILRFLISRYEGAESQAIQESHRPSGPREAPPCFCRVTAADGPPPRSGPALVVLLDDIRRCNEHPRRKLFWWLRFR